MGKSSSISHVVNGYSRYDVPESKAFSCTPGPLYPARIQFVNARDRITIAQGVDVRSNPLAVPTFNPYVIRLHRFWVPLQLYHPELRTNSSKFDMNNLTLNWLPTSVGDDVKISDFSDAKGRAYSNSLLAWLRMGSKPYPSYGSLELFSNVSLPAEATRAMWSNADTYLGYWDIVRNYYGYSQWGLFSIAWPATWQYVAKDSMSFINIASGASFFAQNYCNLEFLDAYFESQFYPNAVPTTNGTYNRYNLFRQIVASQLQAPNSTAAEEDGYPVQSVGNENTQGPIYPTSRFETASGSGSLSDASVFLVAHPLAVVPSSPDRFSRLIPVGSSSDVSLSSVNTIPQLAIASRLQEYKDLLGAGGSRYSDWLETFFASKIEHVDRPKLLFSASQTVNVQVVMNQAGQANFEGTQPLGAMGGSIAFNTQLGRSQSYYFREPGYMFDMISIRPVYYWADIQPDYLNYQGADYFNPLYNDIGYQDVSTATISPYDASPTLTVVAQEPCFNEFRSSYDEVLGQLNAVYGLSPSTDPNGGRPLYSYWVQQRTLGWQNQGTEEAFQYYPALFVDMATVNSPFASNVEDNFFVNLSYSVRTKNLVNKTFATRLSNR